MGRLGTELAQPVFAGGRSRFSLLACLLAVALAVAAIAAGGASAEYRHAIATAEFGPTGTSASSFAEVGSLAYQQAEDRLLVIDAGDYVYGFDHAAPGSFAPLEGSFPIAVPISSWEADLAVDNSAGPTAGDVYLAPEGETISSYDSDGAPLATSYDGEGLICGVAVDNAGRIWGGRWTVPSRPVQFAPGESKIVRTVNVNGGAVEPCKLAVDQLNNDLYVSSTAGGVWRYTAASDYTAAKQIGGNAEPDNRVAVNAAKHVVYIGGGQSSQDKIHAYSTLTGELLETIEPPGESPRGFAVDEETDTLFVALGKSGRVVEMPGVPTPKVASNPSLESTTVTGSADPDGAGPITQCYVEFGPTTDYGSRHDCAQSLPIDSPTPVTATLPGLAFETTYHYRVVVATTTRGAVVRSPDRTLRLHHVRKIETKAASQVDRTKARLNASFEGTGEATSFYFEYGTWTDYGSRFPAAPDEELVSSPSGPTAIGAPISGLAPDTTYHFRVVAKNSDGVSPGDDVEFHTPPAVNAVLAEAPTDVTQTTAILRGSYDGATNDTPAIPLESFHYYFEWGQTAAYGNTTAPPPGVDGGAHAETVHVSAPISGLATFTPGAPPYHYRLVVGNSIGTTYGPDMTFTTRPLDPPQVSESQAEGVLPSAATVTANVNPNGLQSSFVVEYGTKATPYSDATLPRSIGAGVGVIPVRAAIEGLLPGTVYHYRVSATSSSGTTVGPDQTFTTPNAPRIEATEASAGTTSVHFTATVIANASPTAVRFEYGTGDSYGSTTGPVDAGSSLDRTTVGTELSGLQPGTTYHFRALVANGIGSAGGPDQTFTTGPGPAQPIAARKGKAKCKRGFVKRKGKCVKKHRKHKRKKHAGHGQR